MPCNHPRHDHVWPREGLLNIKACERTCFFCGHAALGSAMLLKQHVHKEHVLPDPSGAADLPGLTVVGFPPPPPATEVVTSKRRKRSAFYHRIVIKDHIDFEKDEDKGTVDGQSRPHEEPTAKEDHEGTSEQMEEPESEKASNVGSSHRVAKINRGRARRRGTAASINQRRTDSVGPFED